MLRYGLLPIVLGLLLGCTQEVPVPPVAPMLEDLSTWSVPELVQPPIPPPAPAPRQEKPTTAEKVYEYAPGVTYAVTVPLGWPLDILLERGEQVRNIVGGILPPATESQAPRLEAKEGASGLGDTMQAHIFLTASEAGLTTGLIVTTSYRTYYLTVKSAKSSPVRVVRWQYPEDRSAKTQKPKEPGLLPDPTEPKRYHVGYRIESAGPPPAWMPRGAWDDGKKLYLLYPDTALFGTVPLVREIGVNGPSLLNARQVLTVLIVDKLAGQLELRVGTGEHAEIVTIARGQLTTIECPGNAECPVWPQAATQLPGRPQP